MALLLILFPNTLDTYRNDYTAILVFTLKYDNTTGTLAIHPYVEETDEIPCEQSTQALTPSAEKGHKESDDGIFC